MKTIAERKIQFVIDDEVWDHATDAVLEPLMEVIDDALLSVDLSELIITDMKQSLLLRKVPDLSELVAAVKIRIADEF